MAIELSLMMVSLAVMAGLLVHKSFELLKGTTKPMDNVRGKVDPILQGVNHTTGKFASYLTVHNAVLLANYVFVKIIRLFMHASNKMHRVSSEIVEKASKKTEDLSRGGAASFYLKKIKEGKEGTGMMGSEQR
jgi:hypothetical protein